MLSTADGKHYTSLSRYRAEVGVGQIGNEQAPPDLLNQPINEFGGSTCSTSPTAYRMMLDKVAGISLASLAKCVSAGDPLPLPTFESWQRATGIRIIDGIGTAEMLHIFISAAGDDLRPGATGKPIPRYQAMVVDEDMRKLPPSETGNLAVRGPTGCRYLADERQKDHPQRPSLRGRGCARAMSASTIGSGAGPPMMVVSRSREVLKDHDPLQRWSGVVEPSV